jgi:hypothetical protein
VLDVRFAAIADPAGWSASSTAFPYAETGADIVTVHAEAAVHLHRTLEAIHSAGAKASVAINPRRRRSSTCARSWTRSTTSTASRAPAPM